MELRNIDSMAGNFRFLETLRTKLFFGCCILFILTLFIPTEVYAQKQFPGIEADDWSLALPDVQHVDAGKLEQFRSHLEHELRRVRGLVVVRHGRSVFEYYRSGINATTLHDTASVTKSVISTLVGIATAKNELGLRESLSNFFPEVALLNDPNTSVADMKLIDLLTMTSGFERRGTNTSEDFLYFQAHFLKNTVLHEAFKRPVVNPKGTSFSYSGMDAHLVSMALTRRAGMSARDFANTHLFKMLQIDHFDWETLHGESNGASDLRMTTRGMAKLGVLWLQKGYWRDRQIVPSGYLAEAIRPYPTKNSPPSSSVLGPLGYGYFFWIATGNEKTLPAFFASGHGGQLIYVIPQLHTVIAVSAEVTDAEHRTGSVRTASAVRDYLLPAILP